MSSKVSFPVRPLLLLTLLACVAAPRVVHAASSAEVLLDENALTQLENRAQAAQPKEQCFLYAELVHDLTEIAGKQLADGDTDHISATFRRIDAISQKIHMAQIGRA